MSMLQVSETKSEIGFYIPMLNLSYYETDFPDRFLSRF